LALFTLTGQKRANAARASVLGVIVLYVDNIMNGIKKEFTLPQGTSAPEEIWE
jgi:hypothetical protein